MTHTNPEFIYELKIGIAALQRACYEVIEACVKIDYAIRLLDKSEASSGQAIPTSNSEFAETGRLFTPTTKSRDAKGDPLAELAAQLSPQDREKLISSLEGGKK